MRWPRQIQSLFRALFQKRKIDADMDEEMRSHLEMRTQVNIETGMSPEQARLAALRQFGWGESIKEECRDQRGVRWLENLGQDIRFGTRQLRKNLGFTVVAVLTLALGIGANTAIFTVINAVMLRSLPVTDPHELVQVLVKSQISGSPKYTFSYPVYEQLRDGGQSLSGLFAAGGVSVKDRLKTAPGGDAEIEFVRAQPVSGNFFSVLGVSAMLGRTIASEDDHSKNPQAVAVISHSFWQRRFGGDASVVGRSVTFNDVPFTIIGITPPGFFGFQPGENPELWWPLQMIPQVDGDPAGGRLKEGQQWLRLMGRLSPGVEQRQAEAELDVVYRRYRDDYVATRGAKWSADQRQGFLAQKFELQPGHAGWTGLRDQFRLPLFILMAAVVIVLLIACANVASLLLARAAVRVREFSVRSAIGAGRLRLMRQLLTESLILASLGGLLGLLFAQGGTRLLQTVMGIQRDSISLSLAPDIRVLLFTIAAALLTGLLFGLAPAFRSSRVDLASALKGATDNVSRQRLHQTLVVAQVALSLVLLIGAGLFVRTLRNLKGLDAGFNRENVVLFNIDFAQRADAARWPALYKEILERLEALPGVRTASLFSQGYLSGNSWSDSITAEGFIADPNDNRECVGTRIGPSFFETLGTPLLFGREFASEDERLVNPTNAVAPGTMIINQTMAHRYFGNTSPLGRQLYLTYRPEQKWVVIGIVPDAKYSSLRESALPAFYVPFFQEPRSSWANFALRTSADPRATMADLVSVVRQIDRTLRVRDVRTMDEVVNKAVHQERLVAQLGGFFSVFALVLACLGLYGVLSFAVVQRTREIGVRMALGAQRGDVLFLVVGKGLKLVLAGSVIGLIGGLSAMRVMSSLFYGVTATDPVTLVAVALLLVIVASVAGWLPARRAARVQPMIALRRE